MRVEKFLQKAKRLEVRAYKRSESLAANNVPFTGVPQRHPHNEDKIILVADPFSTQLSYYEFSMADIESVEELPTPVTMEGKSITTVRLWVKKGSIGVRSTPFVVEDTTRGGL